MHLARILLTKDAFSTKQANPEVWTIPDTKAWEPFVHVINIGFQVPPQDLDIPTRVERRKFSLEGQPAPEPPSRSPSWNG